MADARRFSVEVRPRCFHQVGSLQFQTCGELAGFLRESESTAPIGYFCHRHKSAGDKPIPISYLTHRVTLKADLVFAGTSFLPSAARAEVLERLGAALERAGGVLVLHDVGSETGRYEPPPPSGRRFRNGGGGK